MREDTLPFTWILLDSGFFLYGTLALLDMTILSPLNLKRKMCLSDTYTGVMCGMVIKHSNKQQTMCGLTVTAIMM